MAKVLTISIAAYNVERFLEQCLDSLLIPSLDKLEVLIENDGSKDNTAVIGKQYEEKYPETFRLVNKENGGYGSTINNSIALATGKYFKQLDGDDWYNTENLEALVCQLENVDADCVYAPYLHVYEDDGSELLMKENLPAGVMPVANFVKAAGLVQMHALAFRTELLQKHNITILEHCFYTDQEYIVYPFMHTKTVFVWDQYIYCYRLGLAGQSVSLEGYRKHIDEHARVIRQLMANFEAMEDCDPAVRNAILDRICILIRDHYDLDMVLGGRKGQMKALDTYIRKNHPSIFEARQALEGNRIKLIRLSGFALYPLLRKKTLDA